MKNKLNLKMNIIIILSIFLSVFCIGMFIFNYCDFDTNTNLNNLFLLENGKNEIEVSFLNNEDEYNIKFITFFDKVNKKIKSRFF